MAQYIDKDKVVAEIKKKIRTEQGYSSGDAECGYRDCAREILSFLGTLEVKEVNSTDAFTEKATSYIQQHWIWNTKMIEDFKNYMKGE